jgi:hypothetical protein
MRVEIQDGEGKPVPGFSLADCHEIFGDSIARTVAWKEDPDLADLAGQPVRLLFELKDADLFSFQFTKKKAGND